MDWTKLNDEALLQTRIRDLGLQLEETDVFPAVQEVLGELEDKGLVFDTRIYLGDEWFSPEGQSAVAIPFFLAHPRLRQLERKMMLECEGEDGEEFRKLLRHEFGHAFDHAFQTSSRRSWKKLFGSNKKAYEPNNYRPRPYSRNFVQNVSECYAQAHPDEDFAETFAVWLDPKSDWKNRYKGWGAIKKLQYVDELTKEFQGVKALAPRGRLLSDARNLRSTLKRYYVRKRNAFQEDYPGYYDRDLKEIFSKEGEISATQFLRENRKTLLDTTAEWTGEKKIIIGELIDKLYMRCRALKLRCQSGDASYQLKMMAFLTSLVTNYRTTGRLRRLT